ncbi:MAG: hypothetical protein OHK0024_18450 [Thalassobaculales bacterium]
MTRLFKKPPVIHGQVVPGRRLTGWAAVYLLGYVALPLLALGLALDLAGWFVAVRVLGAGCYGIWCLLT